ncbi:MAG: tetratricopeptide repeat protein [Isosphaeraceae bacterium]
MFRHPYWLGLVLAVFSGGLGFWATRGKSPDALFQQASAAYFAGRYDEAAADIARLERLRSPNRFDRLLRGMIAAGRDEPEKAIAELALIGDDDPLAPLARTIAGQTEIRAGRTRPAEAAFLAAIKLLPSAARPRRELIYIYSIQQRQLEMEAQLAGLSQLETLSFDYLLHWSETRNVPWNPKADLPSLQKYIETDPQDRWSRLALANGLRRLARREDAEQLLSYLPDSDPEARAARASLALDKGDLARAEALVSPEQGDCASLARLRGHLALLRHNAAAAVQAYRKALADDPLDRATLAGLGTALKMTGDVKAAGPYLEAARKHDALWGDIARAATSAGQRDPQTPFRLGVACAGVGRIAEAKAWLKLAIKNDPTDRQAQQELYRLEHETGAPPAASVSAIGQ